MQKNAPKPQYEKSLEKRPSGDLFWSPKSIKIDVGAAGNRKNLQKMTKNEVPIFMQIFACEKNAKKRKKKRKAAPQRAARRNARCRREVRRVITLRGLRDLLHNSACNPSACDKIHAMKVNARVYAGVIRLRLARRAGVRRIQSASRIPPDH